MRKLLLILGAILAIPIVAAIGWGICTGVWFAGMTAVHKARYSAAAQAGVPIVEAIYAYRNATELYPETLEDLRRVSDAVIDANRWRYEWRNDLAMLRYTGREVPHGLTYSFESDRRDWYIGNRLYHGTSLDAPVPIPPRPGRTPEERNRLIAEEIERRIARNPTNAVHHQGLVSHYVRAGDPDQALAAATRMHERRLLPWWELQVLARLLHRLGSDNWAEREMLETAASEPGFLPFFYLAWSYRERGDTRAAIEALTKASVCPYRPVEGGCYVDDYYFWIAAVYAYRERQGDLVLALCDRWDEHSAKRGWRTPEPTALRAAALLLKGQTSDARVSIDRAIEMKGNRSIWAEDLDGLSEAIHRGDSAYRWNPGACPGSESYELLILYR